MDVDECYYQNPEFKKKLFLVDDILNQIVPDFNKPIPSSEKLETLSEFSHITGPISRYESGIDCDEVYPNVIVGNVAAARNKNYLKAIGVTHVLNCAQGERFNMVNTNQDYYDSVNIKFKGLKLDDIWMENISKYFEESAQFIDEALVGGGSVLIHCLAGVSRSATIAIAYLMLRQHKSVEEAIKEVRQKRRIRPNEGFLKQLVQLDFKLNKSDNP